MPRLTCIATASVACARIVAEGAVAQEVRTFGATTKELMALSEGLTEHGVTHVAMEVTGVYWRPVWHVLEGSFELVLANAAAASRPTAVYHMLNRHMDYWTSAPTT